MVEACSSEHIFFLQKHSKGKGRHVGWGTRTLAEGHANVMAWADAPVSGACVRITFSKVRLNPKEKSPHRRPEA